MALQSGAVLRPQRGFRRMATADHGGGGRLFRPRLRQQEPVLHPLLRGGFSRGIQGKRRGEGGSNKQLCKQMLNPDHA